MFLRKRRSAAGSGCRRFFTWGRRFRSQRPSRLRITPSATLNVYSRECMPFFFTVTVFAAALTATTSPDTWWWMARAAAGVTAYRGGAYPAGMRGQVFVCDAQNNLICPGTM